MAAWSQEQLSETSSPPAHAVAPSERLPVGSSRLRRFLLAAAGAVIALAVLSQGASAPLSRDDFLSVDRIQDIVQHGHWLIVNDEHPEFTHGAVARDRYGLVSRKPPLFYWLSALVVEVGGGKIGRANVRMVSLLAAVALAAEVLVWTSSQMGESCGIVAFLFLLGSYAFDARATVVIPDMLLSLLVFSAYCMIYPELEGGGSFGRALVAGIILGLAVLTKGPVALVLCALAASLYVIMTRRRPWSPLGSTWPWLVLTVSVGVAACWYVPAILAVGHSLFDVFVTENLGHFLPASMGGTGEAARPLYYISLKLLGGAMPLTFLVPALALALPSGGPSRHLRKPLLFQLGLVLAVVVLFSAANTKRGDYILPAMPGLAILLAALFAPGPARKQGRADYAVRLRDVTLWSIGIGMVALVVGLSLFFKMGGRPGQLPLNLQPSDTSYAALFAAGVRHFSRPFVIAFSAIIIGAAVIFSALARRQPHGTLIAGLGLALLSIAAVSLWTGTLRPELEHQRSLRQFAARVHRMIGDAPLYVLGGAERQFCFYYGRDIPLSGPEPPEAPARQHVYVVAKPRAFAQLAPAYRARLKLVFRPHSADAVTLPSLFELEPAPGDHGHRLAATNR
jgi:Dolichyl-phosphate-mannose-protein mannosyltransferase